MKNIGELTDEVLQHRLVGDLKLLGFKKRARTFYRAHGDAVQVVNVQGSQANIGTSGKFTVNLAVHLPRVATRLARSVDAVHPKEYECTLRRRIGALMPDHADHWWRIEAGLNLALIGNEVAEAVSLYALPWLEVSSSLERVLGGLAGRVDGLTLAAVALELGEIERARVLVEEALQARPAAARQIQAFAERNQIRS